MAFATDLSIVGSLIAEVRAGSREPGAAHAAQRTDAVQVSSFVASWTRRLAATLESITVRLRACAVRVRRSSRRRAQDRLCSPEALA